jgi:hypothetical protein
MPGLPSRPPWRAGRQAGLIRSLAGGKLPTRPNEMVGVAARIAFEIVLVFRLGLPERPGRDDLGDGLAWPEVRSVDVGDGLFGHALLLVVEIVDGGAIARPTIVALAVSRRRIVDLEEKFQDLAIADLARVEHDLAWGFPVVVRWPDVAGRHRQFGCA